MQVAGRAARHQDGSVILYADKITPAMENLINETQRRREIQEEYNKEEGITPTTISKSTENILFSTSVADSIEHEDYDKVLNRKGDDFSKMDKKLALDMMRKEMLEASDDLKFEKAAKLRDEIEKLEKELEGIF